MSSDQEGVNSSEIAESSTSSNIVAKATSLSNEVERLMRVDVDTQDFPTFMKVTMATVSELMKLKADLKDELRVLVGMITQEEGQSVGRDVFVKAQDILAALKAMKFDVEKADPMPEQFKCPISKQIMVDPVILTSAVTYERQNIQACLDAGCEICPESKKPLGHFKDPISNEFAKETISQWCKKHGIPLRAPALISDAEKLPISKEEKQIFSDVMIRLVAHTLPAQKQAAKDMHKLTLVFPQFRAYFAEDKLAISNLLSPLEHLDEDADKELQEDIIETVFNILTHYENIKGFANSPDAISCVIKGLDTGNAKTKVSAANILFTLSTYNDNKLVIGDCGGLKSLLHIIEEEEDYSSMMYAAKAILNLCMIKRNRLKAIDDGAVKVILKKVSDGAYVYELWAILGMLSTHGETILQIIKFDGVRILLHNVRNSNDKAVIENTMAMLDWICSNDSQKLMEIQEEEKQYETISRAARGGTPLAKEGASRILSLIFKANAGI
ncbi:hypothetical protein GIB67_030448 [Kingdonia uniflora]|uniref:RING-type E3 ubiquitin transferase n=1 Tax=Kingdonia uniflora TaxID=39325 RepID=A0A7J7P7A6_9MAGN|nr:hypothetical protein GIB67_030448 [Kingdonia uniflora]